MKKQVHKYTDKLNMKSSFCSSLFYQLLKGHGVQRVEDKIWLQSV